MITKKEKALIKEVETLAERFLNKEITFQEFYMTVQKYPSDIKDRGLTLAILKKD